MRIGIDLSNIKRGGGVTHILELLSVFVRGRYEMVSFVIWGDEDTLSKLPDDIFIEKVSYPVHSKNALSRFVWQHFKLESELRKFSCSILFCPAGFYTGKFKNFVVLCQNMLPFDKVERSRFWPYSPYFRYFFLNALYKYSFVKSSGVIFLTRHAEEVVSLALKRKIKSSIVIPHGVPQRFFNVRNSDTLDKDNKSGFLVRISYVSIINFYKHQDVAVKAVSYLRNKTGLNIELTMVGPSYKPAYSSLQKVISLLDPNNEWIRVLGPVGYEEMHQIYETTDLGLFLSTCENLPIILLEQLAAKVPTVCSNKMPMPEVAGNSVLYCNPTNYKDVAKQILSLIESKDLRFDLKGKSLMVAKKYTWEKTAHKTINYLTETCSKKTNY
jgi:glycosyltransferase involved in cell wall biosynthesis